MTLQILYYAQPNGAKTYLYALTIAFRINSLLVETRDNK
jgi:hypothetical protein